MTDRWFPTEEELDELVPETPDFDLAAVKRRTLARTAPRTFRRTALRGILAAALICLLSVSALAAADRVTNGRVSAALGIVRTAEPEELPEPEEVPLPEPEPEPEPAPEPEVPAYEMDEQVAQYLQVPEKQKRQLQPAGQVLGQSAEAEGVKVTLQQTVGDGRSLYVLVRAELPESVTVEPAMDFREKDTDFGTGSQDWKVLSREDHAITWLVSLDAMGGFGEQDVTITLKDFGRARPWAAQETYVLVPAGKATRCVFAPDGNGRYRVSTMGPDSTFRMGEQVYDPFPEDWEPAVREAGGCLTKTWEDGVAMALVYSEQEALVRMEDTVRVTFGENLDPAFDVQIPGTWTQTWTPDYQDPSKTWQLDQTAGAVTARTLKISPLSLELELTGTIEIWTDLLVSGEKGLSVQFQDGAVLELTGVSMSHDESLLWVQARFPRAMDPDAVTGVTFCGLTFPVP